MLADLASKMTSAGPVQQMMAQMGTATKVSFDFKTNARSASFLQVEDDGTAIAEAVRNVMNLTFDPISKQPFFVGMIKMCHQVRSTRLRDDEVEKLFCSNASAQNKSFTIVNCQRSICQNWLSSHPLEGGNRGATNC